MSSAKIFLCVTAFFLISLVSFFLLLEKREASQKRAVLYSNDGKMIKEYSGKIGNIWRNNEGIKFRLDDRQVIIQGGITVIEEE